MKRSTPLQRRSPLTRDRAPRSRALRRPAMDPDLRHAVFVRAGGRCERCRCPLPADAWEAHHRQLRSRGGPDTMANLVALCRDCHHDVHAHPAAATASGFMVPSWADPATTPTHLHHTRWVLLDRTYTTTTAPQGDPS